MKRSALLLTGVLAFCYVPSLAQQSDPLSNDFSLIELDSILTQEDSLSIFNLIDSLIQLEIDGSSQIAARLGYNSNAASSGRTLGISQFGLSPGISYYHKSGAYLDASGYWSTEYEPSYYLTILSAGYIGAIAPHWAFLGEYSRYLYSDLGDSVFISYKNSIGFSNFIDIKPLTFRLDYNLLFGERTGHRILPGMMLNLEKRNWKHIDRILFYPSFNVLLGSEHFDEEYVRYTNTPAETLKRIRDGLPLYYYVPEENSFGVMNYSFTTPISISVKNWNFLLSYTYNIPKALPREDYSFDNSGYISASITRYFKFK